MAYSGPPNWDEFNDESIAAFWTTQTQTNVTLSETAAGVLRVTFDGIDDTTQRGYVDQYAGDGFTPIASGVAWEFNVRFYLDPTPYSATGPGTLVDVHAFRYFEWTMWDDEITYAIEVSWCYSNTTGGTSVKDYESHYRVHTVIDDEDGIHTGTGPTNWDDWGPAGFPDITQPGIIADKNHNGWFVIKYEITTAGVQSFTVTPEGGTTVDVTPSGMPTYGHGIGGKGGWGWGYDLKANEYNNGPSYVGGSPGPIDIDWVKESYTLPTPTPPVYITFGGLIGKNVIIGG